MQLTRKKQYKPVFTPRFNLLNGNMVAVELQIKIGQKTLSAHEAFKLILSGNNMELLSEINHHLSKWREKSLGQDLYLSWEITSEATIADLMLFLDEMFSFFSLQQLEIMLNVAPLKKTEAENTFLQLFSALPADKRIRKGLICHNPFEFTVDGIFRCVDVLKLKRRDFLEMKDNKDAAYKGYVFIDNLNRNGVEIIADDIYSESDVTTAIMMGIRYGQGYLLSRNQGSLKVIKTLKKNPNSGFYERRSIDFCENLAWL